MFGNQSHRVVPNVAPTAWAIALTAAVAVSGAACVGGIASEAPASPTPAASASPDASLGAVPDVADVICGIGPTTTLLTPMVRPQADGLHIQVTNPANVPLAIDLRHVGGDNAPPGISTIVWPIAPGTVELRCVDTRPELPPVDPEVGWTSLSVVDPDGVFRSTALDCTTFATGSFDYVAGAKGQVGDPVELTKAAISKDHPDDVVEAAGYGGSGEPVVVIVRDGRPIARITWFLAEGGGWLRSTVTTCEGVELSWSE